MLLVVRVVVTSEIVPDDPAINVKEKRENKKKKHHRLERSVRWASTHIRLLTDVRYVKRLDDDFKIALHVFGILCTGFGQK